MSTSAPVRTGSNPGQGPGLRLAAGLRLAPVEAVLARRLIRELWKLNRWIWPAAALITVIVTAVIARFTPITESVWEHAGQWPKWWLFAMGAGVVATYLPVVVLQGVTRRSAARALAASAGGAGGLWAAFMTAGHVIERFVYGQLDWPDPLASTHLYRNGYDVLPIFAEHWLTFMAYLLSGALVGGLYYRFGGILGTVLLPLGLLPAAAIEAVLVGGWYVPGLDAPADHGPVAVLLVAASLVVLALSAVAVHLVLRDIPIKTKK